MRSKRHPTKCGLALRRLPAAASALLALVALFLFQTCGGDGAIGPGQGTEPASNLYILDIASGFSLADVSDSTCLITRTAEASVLSAGDIIASGSGLGFLRRITAISDTGGAWFCATEPASLTDAIRNGSYHAALALPVFSDTDELPTEIVSARLLDLHPDILMTSAGLDLTGLSPLGDDKSTQSDLRLVAGGIRFDPSLDIAATIDDGTLNELLALAGGKITFWADVVWAAAGAHEQSGEIPLAAFEHVLSHRVGPLPVVSVATTRLFLEYSVAAAKPDSVRFGLSTSATPLVGARTRNDNWIEVWNPVRTVDAHPFIWYERGGLSCRLAVRAEMQVAYYDQPPSLIMDLTPTTSFSGTIDEGVRWRWRYEGGVHGGVNLDATALSPSIPAFAADFQDAEAQIAADSGRVIDTWQRSFGGSGQDWAEQVVPTPDGGYVIVGSTDSKGNGKTDIYLMKLSADGQMEWDRTIGGADDDYGYSVASASDGGYMVTGETQSYGGATQLVYVERVDAFGQRVWYGWWGWHGSGRRVIATQDGGWMITGLGRLKLPQTLGLYLLKLDDTGYRQWDTSYTDVTMGHSVVQLSNGDYAVTGYVDAPYTYSDLMLQRFDSRGHRLWSRRFGGNRLEVGEDIVTTNDGDLVFAGHSQVLYQNNTIDFLYRTTGDGILRWSGFSGNSGTYSHKTAQAVAIVPGEEFVMAGWQKLESSLDRDIHLVKVDYFGKRLWDVALGGPNDDEAASVAATPDGGLIVAGKTKTSLGDQDIYIIKADDRGQVGGPITGP